MKRKFYTLIGTALAALALSGCNLDINKDPYVVTNLNFDQLLTATEYEVGINFAEGSYLNANFSAYVHHTVSREIDNYSLVASYATLGNTWEQAYKFSIKNCDALIENADKSGDAICAGIGRVLRTHVYLNLVDLWGDVPYSEANVAGIDKPKADKSADIYNALLESLNAAIANFNDEKAANANAPAGNDLFFKGDVKKWIKAANTLKLKLLVQSRLAKSQVKDWKSELDALLAGDNFLADGEDLQFPHSTAMTPSDERNSGYVDEYQGGQKTVYISPWFYECMSGNTYNWKDNPFVRIKDPRIPYYFYNQVAADGDAANKTDYRDGAFISIVFGSNSGFTSMTQEKAMTTLGIYPVGGKFDKGEGTPIDAKSGNGIAPDKMLMAYSVPFMKAELILAGEASGDAKEELKKGIASSIAHVNSVTAAADPTAPKLEGDAVTDFIDAVLAKYDAANDNRKMEIVMTQKWIANFYNPVEAYNDIRRTGYPVLFKGDAENLAWSPYAQEVEATPGLVSFELVNLLDFPRILYYPQSETTVNPNITNKGRIVSSKNVFWDAK